MVDLAVIEPEEHDNDRRVAPERAAFMVLGRLSVERAHHWAHLMSTSRAVLALVAANTLGRGAGDPRGCSLAGRDLSPQRRHQ